MRLFSYKNNDLTGARRLLHKCHTYQKNMKKMRLLLEIWVKNAYISYIR